MISNAGLATTRQDSLHAALFRGHELTLGNPNYRRSLEGIVGTLLTEDREPADLTVVATGIGARQATAQIVAREAGVVAGLQEAAWIYRQSDVSFTLLGADGDRLAAGAAILEARGDAGTLLGLERVTLNVLQRMCGIASTTRRMQDAAGNAAIAGTRKTPWGLLDKRAVHLGGGATHRLGLGDAILIKNNHLALIDADESIAAPRAIETAWSHRRRAGLAAAFIEVEVRSLEAARLAAATFRRLQDGGDDTPCLLLLDNMTPSATASLVAALHADNLWDHVLFESSGNISESNIADYARTGVDIISSGALTHSVRALDLHQRMIL